MNFWIRKDRVLCDVLEDLRNCYRTRDFTRMKSLIEEAQSMGNRMENALEGRKTYYEICKVLRDKLKEMVEKYPKLDDNFQEEIADEE